MTEMTGEGRIMALDYGHKRVGVAFSDPFRSFAMPDVTLWAGFAYDTKGNVIHKNDEILTINFWASYNLTKEVTVAAEWVSKDGGKGDKGYNWLLFLNYAIDKNWSSAFRVSGEKLSNDGPGFTKLTAAQT
jgi:hypothetical protein